MTELITGINNKDCISCKKPLGTRAGTLCLYCYDNRLYLGCEEHIGAMKDMERRRKTVGYIKCDTCDKVWFIKEHYETLKNSGKIIWCKTHSKNESTH